MTQKLKYKYIIMHIQMIIKVYKKSLELYIIYN